MARPFDLSVYLITDARLCAARGLVDTVRLAVEGGATMVQLRDPEAPTRRLVDEARALVALLRPLEIPLIVNDRVDVALAAGADGVHLGQDDMPPSEARGFMGQDAIIGLSIGSEAELRASAAELGYTDYIGTGPVAVTRSKADAGAAIGVEGFEALRGAIELPMVAIGGIDAALAAEAVRVGADGVAVVSAICGAADPERATRRIAQAVTFGLSPHFLGPTR
jgi:thiamine-phosphate pyrophosphorylase